MAGDSDNLRVLAIAGFDPSGSAGVIADVRTLSALGCMPAAAITSLTFQNSDRFFGASHQTAESLRSQIIPVINEFRVAAVKIGMLPTRELVLEVVHLLRQTKLPAPVIDPVLHSSSGGELMEAAAREVWLNELMPLARLITPNIPEAEILTGAKIQNEADMRAAASALRARGVRAVLVKGGHLKQRPGVGDQKSEQRGPDERQAIDLLDDAGTVTEFRGDWIEAPAVRGTGCMLSSAIAAGLSQGMELTEAVDAAKRFVADVIRAATS
jgi:hydroxymethylpyrimidine kinase/phosphomethylpyrimidine kinase